MGEDYDSGLHFAREATICDPLEAGKAKFQGHIPDGAPSAQQIDIYFNGRNLGKVTNLHYNEDTGLYTATQYNGDYIDGNTQEPVTFRNVIAITAKTRILDEVGRLQVDLVGEGSGYYACGGKYEEIRWKRDSLSDCCHYYHADGSELQVGIGTTYVGVLSQGSTATIQSVIQFS